MYEQFRWSNKIVVYVIWYNVRDCNIYSSIQGKK